jgi:hypothetical protein
VELGRLRLELLDLGGNWDLVFPPPHVLPRGPAGLGRFLGAVDVRLARAASNLKFTGLTQNLGQL